MLLPFLVSSAAVIFLLCFLYLCRQRLSSFCASEQPPATSVDGVLVREGSARELIADDSLNGGTDVAHKGKGKGKGKDKGKDLSMTADHLDRLASRLAQPQAPK